MTESPRPRTTVSTDATATVRSRPAMLLMVARVRAADATLELGLAEVGRRAADAARRLAWVPPASGPGIRIPTTKPTPTQSPGCGSPPGGARPRPHRRNGRG